MTPLLQTNRCKNCQWYSKTYYIMYRNPLKICNWCRKFQHTVAPEDIMPIEIEVNGKRKGCFRKPDQQETLYT